MSGEFEKALGIRPLFEIETVEMEEITPYENKEAEEDISTAKENVHNIIQKGSDALDSILQLAKSAESARAYEVVSTMMKTLLDANKDFVDLSIKKKAMQEVTKPATQTNNITNHNNLIMSTADVIKMLKNKNDTEQE